MLSLASMTPFSFPDNFQFGAAMAGYQVEGNCQNTNIWQDEHERPKNYPQKSGSSCNHWEMYK